MKRAFGSSPMAVLRMCLADCSLAAEQQCREALLLAVESLPRQSPCSPGAMQMPEVRFGSDAGGVGGATRGICSWRESHS